MKFCLSLAVFATLSGAVDAQNRRATRAAIGNQKQRAELFNQILAKTLAREAFSLPKNESLGLDVEAAMRACQDDIVNASNQSELLQALVKLSCARRDHHLSVDLVRGGLRPEIGSMAGDVPVRFAVDYGKDGAWNCFVGELPTEGAPKGIQVGDVVIAVHGRSFADWSQEVAPYLRSSTEVGLWREYARALSRRSWQWPTSLCLETAAYRLRRHDGSEVTVELEWVEDVDRLHWSLQQPYPQEFELVLDVQTYDLYRHATKKVLVLDWYGFREDLVKDMDRLMALAEERDWLDYAIIWDGTRSRGGSRGAYAVQRLFSEPFRTTFGNLRLSDVVPKFIAGVRGRQKRGRVLDSGVAETMDDGNWLLDWLEQDVTEGMTRGQDYSNNVPFKLAHLPKYSDGIIHPAGVHFSGPVVCLLGPQGGSHLDQFASIVVDNHLAHTIGMSTGGYSNTWEWEEVLTLPGTSRPLAQFMWSIGHTLRPNGEVLEGNPAKVAQFVPVTGDNYASYRSMLVELALAHLAR